MQTNQVSRDEVREKLVQLISGDIDRMSASEWAINIVDDDHVRITDSTIWKILQCLGSVDLPTTDRDYLYENDDFIAWLSELN